MEPTNFEELIKTAGEAYAVLKQSGLTKPLKEGALKFTNWFGSLFTRKLHKEKIILMEQLKADKETLKMLQLEVEAQAEENEILKQEISQNQNEFNKLRKNPEFAPIFNIANSKLKNVVNAPISNVTGNINIGDTYNK